MKRTLIASVLLCAIIAGLAAYSDPQKLQDLWAGLTGEGDRQPKSKPLEPALVRTAVAMKRDVPILLTGVGNVEARSTVEIKPRIDGQIVEAAVQDGQLVKQGDILFRLDARALTAELRQAEANLARDRANLVKARNDLQRFGDLAKKGVSPTMKLEEVQTGVEVFEAAAQNSEAAVELGRLNIEYATIRAPISGRVGSVLMSAGNVVKANDTDVMLVINEVRPINVEFALPEKYIAELRIRMNRQLPPKVRVSIQGDETLKETGVLFFIDNAVDAATGTIKVKARVENTNERLVPGQFARAELEMETLRGGIVVPAKSVQMNQKGFYIWVVGADGTVDARSVQIGAELGSETVITRGLAPGDNIVTDGQLRLYPGAKVAPIDDAPKAPKSKVNS